MAVLEAHDVTKSFRRGEGDGPGPPGGLAGPGAGRGRRARGPVGVGEDDAAVHPGLPADAHLGAGRHRGRGGRPAPAGSTAGTAQAIDRLRLPAVQPVPGVDRAGERGVRVECQGAHGPGGPPRGRAVARGRGAVPTAAGRCRATSRAGRSSAWPSPGRWRAARRSSWPTSRPPASIPDWPARSSTCSPGWPATKTARC